MYNSQFTKGLRSLVQMDRVGADTKRCTFAIKGLHFGTN